MALGSAFSGFLVDAAHDLRIALRRMRHEPALTAAVVLTLGLGLGAAAAIFTAFDAALLRPPPFAEPGALVHLWEQRPGSADRGPTSWPTFEDWRARDTGLAGLEGYNPSNITVGVGNDAKMLRGGMVTTGFFRLLGVPPVAGRDFVDADAADAGTVAIVSQRFATAHGDDARPGRTITVNGAPLTIVGVLPAAFGFAPLQDADIYVPLVADGAVRTDRTDRWIDVIGRLREGTTPGFVRARLAAVMAELGAEYPDAMAGREAVVVKLGDALLGHVRPILVSLAGAVALLLVTMATNLALLMLTRLAARGRELAMRATLGASRMRILRQLFAESLALAAGGFAIALLLGDTATNRLLATIPDGVRIDMPWLAGAGMGAGTVAFVAVTALLLTLAFGVGPAIATTYRIGRPADSRTTTGRAERGLRRGLVVAQLAFTVVLLTAAALLVGSFRNLLGNDVGFSDPAELVTARVPLSGERYQDATVQRQFFQELLDRTAAVPGVRAVTAVDRLPLGGGGVATFEPTDAPVPPAARPRAAVRRIAGAYFATMGIPLLAGRVLDSGDRDDTRPVAVVSEGLAQMLADDGTALGRRLRLDATDDIEWEVVGVVGDVQVAALDAANLPAVYVSHLQLAENRMSVVARTALGPGPVAAAVRDIVRAMDPAIPVYAVGTLERQTLESRAVFSRRFPMLLCLAFATAALLLALVALYSLNAHEVLARRREFAVRLALGASPKRVRATVLRGGLRLAVAGVAIGAVAALAASRMLRSLLFGMRPDDWRVYGAVVLGVIVSALLATAVPALRAARLDPGTVMREV
jgi:predicted permease